MQARTVILNAAGPQVRACVGAALGVMPLPPIEDGVRFLWVDDTGRPWLREGAEDAARWSVWRRDGTLLGTPVLSATFDFLQADRDVAIGRIAADDDTERVVVLRITDPRDGGDCLPAGSGSGDLPEPPRHLQVHTRNMTTVQELMRFEGSSYSMTMDARYISVPETVQFWMYAADPLGWVGGVVDLETGQACLMSVGGSGPAVWPDGAMACG